MVHSPGISQDTKALGSCAGNRAKMLLKGHLGLKCHSQHNKVIRLLQYSSANSQWGWLGCNVRDVETIVVLVLLAFNFIPRRSHHSLTLSRSRIRDSATVTLSPADGTTAIKGESSKSSKWSHQFSKWSSSVCCRLISLFSRMGKSTDVYRRNNNGPKNTALWHSWHNVNLFIPTTIHHNVLWSVW